MDLFPVGEYLQDELEARGWTTRDCAKLMGGNPEVDQLALDFLLAQAAAPVGHAAESIRIGENVARGLEVALGTSHEMWLNLDAAYHRRVAERNEAKVS